MSKFNTQNTSTKPENYAGGEAYTQTPKLELVSLLLTSFVKDQYYRSDKDGIKRLQELISQIPDKKFVAKAGIYARTKFGMRSVSHVLAAELASQIGGQTWGKDFYSKIIHRPDDMLEILAYYNSNKGKSVANSIKKGFAKAFDKFDGYQLAKYRGEGKSKSLVDVVNLVRPRPTDKNQEALKQLIDGTLKSTETWEAKLTEAGNKDKGSESETFKTEAWEQLIREQKIGYFALLRNLRNIIQDAPLVLKEALEILTDEKRIKNSLVLPFRFTTAMEEIEKLNGAGVTETIVALSKALDISVNNVPHFDGSTLVALDTSGSMGGQPVKIGSLFAAILVKANNADFVYFNNDAHYKAYNPLDSTMTIASDMKKLPSGGTDFNSIFEEANAAYDRIIILSDMQAWVGWNVPTQSFNAYKTRLGANPKIYSFDLQGLGTMQFPENNVFAIAGFSEKIFDVMKMLEQDRNALISEIEKVEL